MQAYCVKCRTKPATQGICPTCGTKNVNWALEVIEQSL